MKRKIVNFSKKISQKLSKPDKKFTADMTYGILASKSCLLTDVVDQLHEDSKKVNSIERLTRHLNNGTPLHALHSYLSVIRKWVPDEPVIHIDDSDVVKPDGYKFEALGLVRDGSRSTDTKNVYEKGYHVTEACVLTKNDHPVSTFSEIYSSKEKNFTSVNNITFSAMARGAALLGRATFAMDRGYDNNKMFLKLDELKQDYVIRLTARRKLFFHGKWIPATQLRNQRKGKIKMPLVYKGKKQVFQFENFRVRKLAAINALNFYITLCMAFLAHISMKPETNALKVAIIKTAAPIKENVHFCYYRLAKGITGILSYAKAGIRLWFRTKRPAYRQLCFKLTA